MRQLMPRLLSVFLLGVIPAMGAGCGADINAKIACSTDGDCLKASRNLFDIDASADFLPQCCGSICAVAAIGCDSGYRYLVSAPAVGECAVEPMCKPRPDMSLPSTEDMSETD